MRLPELVRAFVYFKPSLIHSIMPRSFTQLYFGKAIDEVKLDDIIAFFAEERPESINLEFKSFVQRENDIKLKEKRVTRTVCAFLNSESVHTKSPNA